MKPDWSNAPEWANYWAVDANGEAFWYEDKPYLGGDLWRPDEESRYQFDGIYSWSTSLTERPVQE